MLESLRDMGRRTVMLAAIVGVVPMICAAQQSYLGIAVQEVNNQLAEQFQLSEVRGVVVSDVVADSAAAKAGIEEGDVVLEYNGQRVEGTQQFVRLVRETPVGREVALGISRNGQMRNVQVEMGSRTGTDFGAGVGGIGAGSGPGFGPGPEGGIGGGVFGIGGEVKTPAVVIPDMPRVFTTWRSSTLGVEAESLNEQLASYFGVEEGVLVRSVGENTPAEKAGFRAGDVILRVGDEEVTTPREVTDALRGQGPGELAITIMRDHQQQQLTVTIEEPQRRGLQQFVMPFQLPGSTISF